LLCCSQTSHECWHHYGLWTFQNENLDPCSILYHSIYTISTTDFNNFVIQCCRYIGCYATLHAMLALSFTKVCIRILVRWKEEIHPRLMADDWAISIHKLMSRLTYVSQAFICRVISKSFYVIKCIFIFPYSMALFYDFLLFLNRVFLERKKPLIVNPKSHWEQLKESVRERICYVELVFVFC
jgi:hypothetical protein